MPSDAQQKQVIVVKNGVQLYDVLIREIDPELTSAELPKLAAKYASETFAQRTARAKRYEKAFAEYDKRIAGFFAGMNAQLATCKKTAFASAERKSRAEEEQRMQQMETTMFS